MRKVLSFVLVLALVLSSFSMAFAADSAAAGLTDIAGNANEDAIQVSYDLGIVTGNPDGTFLPDKTVTRAEFAAMITRALAIPDSALAGYTSTSFKDTVGYGWAVPYLAFSQSKGIMLGDGAGNAMPGRTITVNEAMTMALRAIGYTANSALLVGAWPANYVSIAQNESLYDDVAADAVVTKASAAQIIYNLLTVQKVAVNTDGETKYLENKDGEINLLNSNLGATAGDKQVLGDLIGYGDSKINITNKIGAYGTPYTNSDDELIAFDVDSKALTGKIDGTGANMKFKVGDTKYEFGSDLTEAGITFVNTDADDAGEAIDAQFVKDFAANNVDDGKTVTLNVDLSGKKIKDVYSIVGWAATAAELAASDVQDDITDDSEPSLLGFNFDTDDDDAIKANSFALAGVASLDKIAEDNVVYVYVSDDDDVIRKVEVGTETVEGIVDEINDDSDNVTIGDKSYDVAKTQLAAVAPALIGVTVDLALDDEGTFYLNSAGKIFDFDGTSNTADSYAIVRDFHPSADSFDDSKVKLYNSDESKKTVTLAYDLDDEDFTWIDEVSVSALQKGDLIGYSLDSDGNLDTANVQAVEAALGTKFQSTKVLDLPSTTDKAIASDAVVFTYSGDYTTGDDYGVSSLADVEKGVIATSTQAAFYILNGDGKVAALFVEENLVKGDSDAVYGVLNSRTNTQDSDDNDIFRYKGFIDGAAFNYVTDDTPGNTPAKQFKLYEISVDANNVITAIAEIGTNNDSYALNSGSSFTVKAVKDGGTRLDATDGNSYTVDDSAVVYKYDPDAATKFSVAKLSNLKKNYTVKLYDTKGDDSDGIATVVLYQE